MMDGELHLVTENSDGFVSSWEGGYFRKVGQRVRRPGGGKGNGVRWIGGEETILALLEGAVKSRHSGISSVEDPSTSQGSLKLTQRPPWPEKTKQSGLHSLNVPSCCSREPRPHPQVPLAEWGGSLQSTTELSKT